VGYHIILAKTAYVILICLLFPYVAAIVFGLVGLRKAKSPRRGGRAAARFGTIAGVLGFPVVFVGISAAQLVQGYVYKIQCASQLKEIGNAILMYCNENRGNYPPDFGALIKSEPINPEVFICPGDGAWVPTGLTKDQTALWVNQNSSYLYLGDGLTSDSDPAFIVAYDKDGTYHHGVNVLYADGHIDNDELANVRLYVLHHNPPKNGGAPAK
jgi:prepilin-type processing-associated H-X9-DG protein